MAPSLKERFDDLDRRITELERRHQTATPEEHDIAELVSDLLGRRERLRGYLDPRRGTAATGADVKTDAQGSAPMTHDTEAETELAAMERDLETARAKGR